MQQAELITLDNGHISAQLTDVGASLVSLVVPDARGQATDVALGLADREAYRTNDSFLGTIVGRVANRTAGASFELEGQRFELARNDGANNNHSGPDVLAARTWEVVERTDTSVAFALESPDGDQGFPGTLHARVTYELEATTLRVRIQVTTDATTLANPLWHDYLNLNGHAAGTAMHHLLQVDATRYTPAAADVLPTGEVAQVAGTAFDFRGLRPLDWAGSTYDTNFVLDHCGTDVASANGGVDGVPDHSGTGIEPGSDDSGGNALDNGVAGGIAQGDGSAFGHAAQLVGDASGIVLDVWTDRPGLQLYTASFLDEPRGKGGAHYGPQSAVCLETQLFPDAIHHPTWPSPILRAGERLDTCTEFRFSTVH
jgi:aldose 1-epimerase